MIPYFNLGITTKFRTQLKDFDLTGFVRFPHVERKDIKISNSSQTLVYLIAIDVEGQMSNVKLNPSGIFLGDDITFKTPKIGGENLEKIIESFKSNDQPTSIPDTKKSINVLSSIFIGWSNLNYTYKNDMSPWICSFRDLTNEGRRLYYSIRKLHNESEIRLLTFNKN